jgi:hypothetical protein
LDQEHELDGENPRNIKKMDGEKSMGHQEHEIDLDPILVFLAVSGTTDVSMGRASSMVVAGVL